MSLGFFSPSYVMDSDDDDEDCSESGDEDTSGMVGGAVGVIGDGDGYDTSYFGTPNRVSEVDVDENENENEAIVDPKPSPKLKTFLAQSLLRSYLEEKITMEGNDNEVEEEPANKIVEEEIELESRIETDEVEPPSTPEIVTEPSSPLKMDPSVLWPFTHCKIILSRGPPEGMEGSAREEGGWAWEGKNFVYYDKILSVGEADDVGVQLKEEFEIQLQSIMKPSPSPEVKLEGAPETIGENSDNVQTGEQLTKGTKTKSKRAQNRKRPAPKKNSRRRRSKKKKTSRSTKDDIQATPPSQNDSKPDIKNDLRPSLPSSPSPSPTVTMSTATENTSPSPRKIRGNKTGKKSHKQSINEAITDSQLVSVPITRSERRSTRKRGSESISSEPKPTQLDKIPTNQLDIKNSKTKSKHFYDINNDAIYMPPHQDLVKSENDKLTTMTPTATEDDVETEAVYKCPFCLIICDEPGELIDHLSSHNNNPAKVTPGTSLPNPIFEDIHLRSPKRQKTDKPKSSQNETSGRRKDKRRRNKTEPSRGTRSSSRGILKQASEIGGVQSTKLAEELVNANHKRNVTFLNEGKEVKMHHHKLPNKGTPSSSHAMGGTTRPPLPGRKDKCQHCKKQFQLPSQLWKHLLENHQGKA